MNDAQIDALLLDMDRALTQVRLQWQHNKSLPLDKLSTVESGVNKLNRQIMMGRK